MVAGGGTIGGVLTVSSGLTVTAGGLSVVSGGATIGGVTTASSGLTITAGGLSVTAGGATISSSGANTVSTSGAGTPALSVSATAPSGYTSAVLSVSAVAGGAGTFYLIKVCKRRGVRAVGWLVGLVINIMCRGAPRLWPELSLWLWCLVACLAFVVLRVRRAAWICLACAGTGW